LSATVGGGLGVDEVYSITIAINGAVPDPNRFAFGYLRILESVVYPLPVGTILFSTDTQYWTDNPVFENDQVHITFTPLKSVQQETEVYDFRVYSVNQTYMAPYRNIKIVLITDSPTMFYAHPRTIEGTSRDVFQQLADENVLYTDFDDSNDRQLWPQANRRNVLWAKFVCDHAYLNETSHYAWCNTRDNYLKFVNLDIRKKLASKWVFRPEFVGGGGNVMYYSQIITNINSGLMNRSIAYGTSNNTVDFDTGTFRQFNPDDFSKLSVNPQYDSSQDSFNRVFTLAPNIGNDHTYYNDAHVQNPRLRAMYSTRVRLGTQFPLNAAIFDMCDFEYYDVFTHTTDEVFTGRYLISQIDTRIGGAYIYRFFELISDGTGTSADEGLTGGTL